MSLLLLVGAMIVYFDLLVPAYGDLQEKKGEAISEAALLDNEKQVVTQVQALVSAYQSQSQGQQSVNLALPVGPDVAGALTQIYGIAANDSFAIQNVNVSMEAPQIQTPADTDINAAATGGSILKPTGSVSYKITAAGTYESLKAFLKHVATNARLLDVTAVSVSPVTNIVSTGKNSSNILQDYFNYSITVVSYYQTP